MKFFAVCLAVLLSPMIVSAGEPLPKGKAFQPVHFEIIWAAPTNKQPTALWIYRNIPQEFSTRAISNLMIMGSFTAHDARKLSDEERGIDKQGLAFSNEEETRFLGISPALGLITYQDQKAGDMTKPASGVPSEAKVKKLALKFLEQIGIPQSNFATTSQKKGDLLSFKDQRTRGYFDKAKKKFVEEADYRGIFFVRRVDGVNFAGIGVAGGFYVGFGNSGKIAKLELVWRNLQPYQRYETASPEQIMAWVKEGKAVMPYPLVNPDLNPSEISKLTIKEFSPLYKGALADEPQEFTFPFAQLNCIASVGKTNVNLQLYCPILSTKTATPAARQLIPKQALNVLENADEFTLLSLNPEPGIKATNDFHGFPVLGKVQIKEPSQRQAILNALYSGITKNGLEAMCFSPRHGLHTKLGNKVEDLLICFECSQIYFHGVSEGKLLVNGTPAGFFNHILADANVPVSK
jgi:hypothetical protein